MKYKILGAVVLILTVAAICFVGYGIDTDCANTSGYVDCSEIK